MFEKGLKIRLSMMGTLVEQAEEVTPPPQDGNITALTLGRGHEGWGDSRLSPAPKTKTRSFRKDHSTRTFEKLVTSSLPREMQEEEKENGFLSGTVPTNKTIPAPQKEKLSETALRQVLQSGTVPERKLNILRDQKEDLDRIEAFKRQEHFGETSKIRTVPDNFDIKECEDLVFISDDSYGVVTSESTTDNVLFERRTTAKTEDSRNFVVKKQLLGGTGGKISENLQAVSVVKKLSFDLENRINQITPESGKSGSLGIPEQAGKRKKLESRTVPQEKVRKVLGITGFHEQKSADKMRNKLSDCSKVEEDSMTVGRIGSRPVQIEEGNVEGKLRKLLRKTIPTDLLNLKVEKKIQRTVTDSDGHEQLGLCGNNVRMQRDRSDAEDDSVSRMRLLVGTVKCEGESAACSKNSYDHGVKLEAGNVGMLGITGMVQKSDAQSVGMADGVGRLLGQTVPSSVRKCGRVIKPENMSPGLKQNLKQSSSSSGRKFGTEMFGMGSPQAGRKSRMGAGKLSKNEKLKIKKKLKLFEIFQKGGKVKTIGASVTSNFESISNDCVAGNSRREQVDTGGPIGVEPEPRVESRSIPCGQRQKMEAARIFGQSEIKP